MFAAFVFDIGEQQACVVVAIAQLAAVRIDTPEKWTDLFSVYRK
jgi:hypothetical protein